MTQDGAATGRRAPVDRPRSPLLRWGLPRDPAATSHLAGFVVASVATVLLTRGYLAVMDYPQIGGGGLHVAHVLWGGLLMALAFVLLLSFAGPVVRPAGALLGGIGFGLFVDEVGKFVTSDNDYFYEPTAALIYLVTVALVLLGEALHGRTPHHPVEYLAGAADHAVAGLAGGFTTRTRAEAHALVDRAGPVRGEAEVRALLDVAETDSSELPNPIEAVGHAVVGLMRRLVSTSWAPWLTVGVLLLSTVGTVGRGVLAWVQGAQVPAWIVVGLLVSAAIGTGFAALGLWWVRGARARGYRWFRRAVLVNLLVTQVFLFRVEQWSATTGLIVDLLLLGLVAAELNQMSEAGRLPGPARRRGSGPSTDASDARGTP
ncbi:hypothetical protein [Actinotalea sp. C106]|uniref:hypothetical protein n=1 Tax=Actinotalea sp. C106 TaxID=2908644 RepID=UPI0020289B2C|nr:hypothetical protein [Actinotalea sp. C106]